MHILKKIDPLSWAIILSILAIIAFVFLGVSHFLGINIAGLNIPWLDFEKFDIAPGKQILIIISSILLKTIVSGILGFIAGYVGAMVLNWILKLTGGLKFEIHHE